MVKCPSCKDAKSNKCCSCQISIPRAKKKWLRTDPFAAEIDEDFSLHLLCLKCIESKLDDI